MLEPRLIEVSRGDRLLLTANRREVGCGSQTANWLHVSVVDCAGGIQLEDGREPAPQRSKLRHGYAVTAHRSQGKTVDSVIISGDGMQKELFYVAASRGRQSVTVITSDKERLGRPWHSRWHERQHLIWYVASRVPAIATEGMAMAREMVRRTAKLVSLLKEPSKYAQVGFEADVQKCDSPPKGAHS